MIRAEGGDVSEICDEWQREYRRHPSFGEGRDILGTAPMWDDTAETYSGSGYGRIRGSIIERLVGTGVVGPGKSILDIGCGPGLYSIPFSRTCGSVFALDISAAMLRRLRRECETDGITNIIPVRSGCLEIPEECSSDVAFCSLCPPMNTPEAILYMERFARERCVYVSSANVPGGLETEIWNALGRDYSYGGYDTCYPYRFLLATGRSPVLEFFTEDHESVNTTQEVIDRFTGKISKYRMLDDDARRTIAETVMSHDEGGLIVQRNTVRMGLLIWEPMDY